MTKQEMRRVAKIKKDKIIGIEMNIALRENDIVRESIELNELISLVHILEENLMILRQPGIISRIGAYQESQEYLQEAYRKVATLVNKLKQKREKVARKKTYQEQEIAEVFELEEEINKPATVIEFRARNVV